MKIQHLSADLCAIGGGMSGVCVAISAARLNAKVTLGKDHIVLGGNASSHFKMHIAGADYLGNQPGARQTVLIDEFRLEDAGIVSLHVEAGEIPNPKKNRITLDPPTEGDATENNRSA